MTWERDVDLSAPPAVALFAVGVWLLTMIIAHASEWAGVRGPAEVLLRRLVYPRSGTRARPAT